MKIQLIEEYIEYKINLNRKQTSQLVKPLYRYCEWLASTTGKKVTGQTLVAVDGKLAQEYVYELKKEYAHASVQKHVTIIKGFYAYAMVARKDCSANPFSNVQIPYETKARSREKMTITDEQINNMLNQADDTEKLMILLASEMGMRKTEVISLKVSDVNLENGTINFKRKGYGELRQTLPIMKKCSVYIAQAVERAKKLNSTFLFPSKSGKQLAEKTYWNIVNRVATRSGVEGVHPHLLRAKAITDVYNKTDIMTASKFANHSDIATTQRYITDVNLDDKLRGL